MAVLVLPGSMPDVAEEVTRGLRQWLAGQGDAWLRCVPAKASVPEPPVQGDGVDRADDVSPGLDGAKLGSGGASALTERERQMLELAADALWRLGLPREDGQHDEERLLIVPVHVSDPTVPAAALESAAEEMLAAQRVLAHLLAERPASEPRSSLAARIRLCPWLFLEQMPDSLPSALFHRHPGVSDHPPLPVVHTSRTVGGDIRTWTSDGRRLLLHDLIWLLVASGAGHPDGLGVLLPSPPEEDDLRWIATTATARLVLDDEPLARPTLARLQVDVEPGAALRGGTAPPDLAKTLADESDAQDRFADCVESAATPPAVRATALPDERKLLSDLQLDRLGPSLDTWPGITDEAWSVLAPPLRVADVAERLVHAVSEAESLVLTTGLEAEHARAAEQGATAREALADWLRSAADSAPTAAHRVHGQLAILGQAEATLRKQVAPRPRLDEVSRPDLTERVGAWVERERVLALDGANYPSRGAQWVEFVAVFALGVALALVVLPLVVVPPLAIALAALAGGAVLWLRRRQWRRHRRAWDTLADDIRRGIAAHLRLTEEGLGQRVIEARLAELAAVISRIQTARGHLVTEAQALDHVVSEFDAGIGGEEGVDGAAGAREPEAERRGLAFVATDDAARTRTAMEIAHHVDRPIRERMTSAGILDAARVIRQTPQPLPAEKLEWLISSALTLAHRLAACAESREALERTTCRAAQLGWHAGRLSAWPTASRGPGLEDRFALLVGEVVADALGPMDAADLATRATNQLHDVLSPAVRLQSASDPVSGLPADTAVAVRVHVGRVRLEPSASEAGTP